MRVARVFPFFWLMLVAGRAVAQDFDPGGRRHKSDAPTSRAPTRPQRLPSSSDPVRPPGAKRDNGPADRRAAQQSPDVEKLIARYTAVALAQPSSPFPLQRLAQLYRERDGTLRALLTDLEHKAGSTGPGQRAAGLLLARAYVEDGRPDDAVRAYEAASAANPKDPDPLRALAELARDRGDLNAARGYYERALPLVGQAEHDAMLRAVLAVLLDIKAFDQAKKVHTELVQRSQGSLFVRGELGRELESRGELERGEAEFRALVTAAAGDNRTLAPALRDLGRVLVRENKHAEALATLKRALALAGSEAGVRGDIFKLIAEVYRAQNQLGELIVLIEAEHPSDLTRLTMLGALYEETGQVDRALSVYRRALGGAPSNIDLRVKVIHLLQSAGELESAIREYEALIRAAPRNPDYVFELCETLIARGERARALGLLQQLERRAADDPDALARVADFYERAGEAQRAVDVLARVSASAPGDATRLADLGDRFYQQGDKKRAVEVWNRIKTVAKSRAEGLATLGEVYLDHDMPNEGLEALKEASQLEPDNTAYRKAYAIALERTAAGASTGNARLTDALHLWEGLLVRATSDKNLARESRAHIVTLYNLLHELEARVAPLTRAFAATPPDIGAGRLLAEVQMRLRRLPDAERTLTRMTELAPGDIDTYLMLERVLVQQQKLTEAIAVLQKLTRVEPKRAREFYQRMAQYAAELYHDDDAIAFAARAVQLSPDDAEGHRKLGEMYRKKQDDDRAIAELRSAITKNDKLYPVYFELAELLIARGNAEDADQLYRRVVRSAPDEELVSQAARQSMQINLGRGTLEKLEQDLLPVAIGNPRKPVYRRLLVELYGAMAFPLIQKARNGAPQEVESARVELRALGSRAIKPLLDALGDDKEAQQRIAVDLLSFVENKSAGPALFTFAGGQAAQPLRIQAMLACGSLRDPALLPKFGELLFPKDEPTIAAADPLTLAAGWSVARLGDRRALPLLGRLLAKGSADLKALAAVGLGLLHDRSKVNELRALTRSAEAGNVARAGAAFALGELGAKDGAGDLLALAEGSDALPRRAALLSLARLGVPAAHPLIADNVLASDPAVRETAVAAMLVLTVPDSRAPREPLPVLDTPVDVHDVLQRLGPGDYSTEQRARALITESTILARAVAIAASSGPERARPLLDALLARRGQPSFAPFTDGIESLPAPLREQTEAAAEAIARAAVPTAIALERSPARDVRVRAIEWLATRREDDAQAALVRAVRDGDPSTARAAVGAVGPLASPDVVNAVAVELEKSEAWAMRVQAAEALGRVGVSAGVRAVKALESAALRDPYALVREAALGSVGHVDANAARSIFRSAAQNDPEMRLRTLAKDLASKDARP